MIQTGIFLAQRHFAQIEAAFHVGLLRGQTLDAGIEPIDAAVDQAVFVEHGFDQRIEAERVTLVVVCEHLRNAGEVGIECLDEIARTEGQLTGVAVGLDAQ